MEGDQSSTADESETKNKKSDVGPLESQVGVVGSGSGSGSTSSNTQARNYECIFCKRGFANAQALGGHMNIHRKDKEKLKLQSHGTTSFIDTTARVMDRVIPRMIHHRPQAPTPTPPVVSWGSWMIPEEGKKAEVKGSGDEVRKLPLFLEQPPTNKISVGDHQDAAVAVPTSRDSEDVDKQKSSSSEGGQGSPTVDLELRLGPEPPDSSSQPLSTRKFF